MNQINPNKLLLSKWTSTSPKQKEKHFIVTKLLRDENNQVTDCLMEAVLTKREFTLPWRELKLEADWLLGWK